MPTNCVVCRESKKARLYHIFGLPRIEKDAGLVALRPRNARHCVPPATPSQLPADGPRHAATQHRALLPVRPDVLEQAAIGFEAVLDNPRCPRCRCSRRPLRRRRPAFSCRCRSRTPSISCRSCPAGTKRVPGRSAAAACRPALGLVSSLAGWSKACTLTALSSTG